MRKFNAKARTNLIAGFKYHCVEAIQMGYDRMRIEKRYQVDWEEDNLTICLVETIKQLNFLGQYQISVNYQSPIYSVRRG